LRRRKHSLFLNGLVALGAALLAAGIAEPLLRLRYAEPIRPVPPVVREVMPYLQANADVGFTWQPNISADRGIVFHNADILYKPLCTDEFGVWNAPDAIARRAAGEPVQVLGLGDSFMEMAVPGFYRAFSERGALYYSMAIHRHSPPQYAAFLEGNGLQLRPKVALLGLFENDFFETEDFEEWRCSGLDWFSYHGGTWFGAPSPAGATRRFIHTWLLGYEGLAKVIRVRLRGERMSVAGPSEHQVARVSEYLAAIAARARESDIDLWVVLIPSKPTARGDATAEAAAYDRVLATVGGSVAGVIDLRPVFRAHPDPASLYYREDGHWNDSGVALAADTILGRLWRAVAKADQTTENMTEIHESRSH